MALGGLHAVILESESSFIDPKLIEDVPEKLVSKRKASKSRSRSQSKGKESAKRSIGKLVTESNEVDENLKKVKI